MSRLGIGAAAIGLLLIAASLIASNSRMGLVACGAGIVTITVLWLLSAGGSVARLAIVAALGVAALLTLFAIVGTDLVGRAIAAKGDFNGRLELYQQVFGMIATRPLTGFGLNTFEVAFPLFHQLPLCRPTATIKNAHSTYLTLWVELGLIVGTIPMLMVGMGPSCER